MQSLEPGHEYQILQSVVVIFVLIGPMNNGETSAKLIALRKEETLFQQPLGLGVPFRNMKSMSKFTCEEIWISFSDIPRETKTSDSCSGGSQDPSLTFGQNTNVCSFGYFTDLKLFYRILQQKSQEWHNIKYPIENDWQVKDFGLEFPNLSTQDFCGQ